MKKVTCICAALLVFLSVSVAYAGVTVIIDMQGGHGFAYVNGVDSDMICLISNDHTAVRCTTREGSGVVPYEEFSKEFQERYTMGQPNWIITPNKDAGKPLPPSGQEAPKLEF